MLPPESVQFIVDMALWAIVIGCMCGFLLSRTVERIFDLVLYLVQRHDRIEAARSRDHAAVPVIAWRENDASKAG